MNKLIGYITANTDKLYEIEIINIMSRQAAAFGCDLVVLTHFVNYDDGGSYIKGDENIYSLINTFHLDGAVIDYSSYYNTKLADKIERLLFNKKIPVIALDYKSKMFESCRQDDRIGFRKITEHFIEVHGYKKIYCLSGPREDFHSVERINGYTDALKVHGIPVSTKNIFYGDFWIDSPKKLAENILSGRLEKPQAVVCGNDYMALQLCLSLSKGGIKIPDEISVAGFDGNPDTLKYQPTVTTFRGAYLKNAVNAICRLYEKISGEKEYEKIEVKPHIRFGSTCSCKNDFSQRTANGQFAFDSALIGNIYLHCSYSSMMNKVSTIDECALTVLQNLYLLDNSGDFFLCLCNDWNGDNNDLNNYRREGYSEEMTCIVSRCNGNGDLLRRKFSLENILPSAYDENKPVTYICTPLHYLERCFGYCVRRYSGVIIFEEYYGNFCQTVSNTIEKARVLQYESYLNEKIQKLSERDILTGLYSKKGLDSCIRAADKSKKYFGVMFYFTGIDELEKEEFKKLIITFSQAVNLSCTNGIIAARTGADKFVMIGPCDELEHPEQLFINTLKLNLKMLEKQQNISMMKSLCHFSSIADIGESLDNLLENIEKRYENFKSAGSEKNIAYLSKIRELHYSIYEEPQLDWCAENEADKIGISQSYFQHLYKKFITESFNSDVITARIVLAERLLINTSLNVSEISERCGYSDPLHFMKLFKRKKGRTALEYRKTFG